MWLSVGIAEAPAAAANRMRIVRFFPKLLIEKVDELRIPKTVLMLRIDKNSLRCTRGRARAGHGPGTELNWQAGLRRFVSDERSLDAIY